MLDMLMMGVAGAGLFAGFAGTRRFVRDRLRFVDAVRKPSAPWLAGAVAALAAAPLAWVLPVLGGGSALLFGVAVGTGLARGRKDFGRLPPG